MDIVTLIGYLITPVTGVIGWFAGTRQRRNSAVQSLQETIQLLSNTIQDDNQKIVSLMNEVQEVRRENADLKAGQKELMDQIEALKTENRELNELIRANGIKKVKPAMRKDLKGDAE